MRAPTFSRPRASRPLDAPQRQHSTPAGVVADQMSQLAWTVLTLALVVFHVCLRPSSTSTSTRAPLHHTHPTTNTHTRARAQAPAPRARTCTHTVLRRPLHLTHVASRISTTESSAASPDEGGAPILISATLPRCPHRRAARSPTPEVRAPLAPCPVLRRHNRPSTISSPASSGSSSP